MLSIICTIHNELAMNKLFLENLRKYTFHPYELIVIDNHSTDGSAEFFARMGARVHSNPENLCYPVCQNQGIRMARYDVLVFINNDVIVSPDWDKHMIEAAQQHKVDIITPVGIEKLESAEATRAIKRAWLRVRNPLSVLGHNGTLLRLMLLLMYGNWQKYCHRRFRRFGHQVKEGIVGNTVMIMRPALDKVGLWDERIQGADFDLFIRTKKRSLEQHDIKPVHVALGVFIHHYIRLTAKKTRTPFADQHNIITVEEKWGDEAVRKYTRGFLGKYENENAN